MFGPAIRLLLMMILLVGGIHNAAPVAANQPHHAFDVHALPLQTDCGTARDSTPAAPDDSDKEHGAHHNCPLASDPAATRSDSAMLPGDSLVFARLAIPLVSLALPPPHHPPLA